MATTSTYSATLSRYQIDSILDELKDAKKESSALGTTEAFVGIIFGVFSMSTGGLSAFIAGVLGVTLGGHTINHGYFHGKLENTIDAFTAAKDILQDTSFDRIQVKGKFYKSSYGEVISDVYFTKARLKGTDTWITIS
ncbi:hypothetical protein [Tepidibacter formicigenes]|jgi:alanine dehydrogenase|uniref:Uncharacterized protein n=1 Tax=Tepidibacter formicigenes DSM 15518 TaxID=1123349 RepID=A0A1M6TXQ5_9FIRM|nr:hypothetical protein [Tepidibacter formicigenes]SHK61664.1 hypothetical protein SAMN02744037_02698 [Tepidibacter formicigenes DSM 15518]